MSAQGNTLDWFQDSRQRLLEAARQLAQLGRQRKNEQLQQRAAKLLNKLNDFYFNLVVLGEFKRGKSTLVNALIGASVLPTATIPLTSVTTIIRYGEQPKVHVSFAHGGSEQVDINSLADYVTERGNPENKRGVDVVEVEYPAKMLRNGVRIIDTPGTGSVYLHNTQTTYEFLPQADAAIFVFAADQPAARTELDLLQIARKFAARIFFVLNKIDNVDEAGLNDSLGFLQVTLERELGEPCLLYPISARNALTEKLSGEIAFQSNGFPLFEAALLHFFATDKAEIFIQSMHSKIFSLTVEVEQLIALERKGLLMSETDLQKALMKFAEAAAGIRAQQDDADHIVRGEILRLIKSLQADLKPVVEENEMPLVKAIATAFDEKKELAKADLINHLVSALKEHITAIFDLWRDDEERKINESFERLNARFVERGNQIIEEIKRSTREIFQLEVTAHFKIEPLTSVSRHYYAVDNPFTLALDTTPLLLPNFLAKQLIRSRFIESAQSELSRNAGRLRADYQERLELSARTFLQKFHQRVSETLVEIENALKRALDQQTACAAERAAAEKRLTAQQQLVDAINALNQLS